MSTSVGRRSRTRSGAGAALLIALLCLLNPPVSSARVRTYLFPMLGKQTSYGYILPEYKPHFLLFAQDGNLYVTGIHWKGWDTGRAVGAGTAHYNPCIPSCWPSHFTAHPARIVANHRGDISGPTAVHIMYYHSLHLRVKRVPGLAWTLKTNWATAPVDTY